MLASNFMILPTIVGYTAQHYKAKEPSWPTKDLHKDISLLNGGPHLLIGQRDFGGGRAEPQW